MGDLSDFQGYEDDLRQELDKLDVHCETDYPHIRRLIKRLDGTVTDSTLQLYLKNLRKTAERCDVPLVEMTEWDLEDHAYELRHDYEFSDGTIRNVEFIVRKLHRELDLGTDWADDYALTSMPDTKVKPEDMLRGEDINALTDAANNLRDIALIEFFADSGARLSLAGSLRVRDVNLEDDAPTYRPNSNARALKGADITDYPIIDSKSVLRTYLHQVHPRPDDPDVAFFHKIPGGGYEPSDDDGALTPNAIRTQLQRAADAAGVERPVNPHNFRHSAVTRMVREGYTRSQIEHRVHWTVDTDMWETYQHIAADEHNEDIFRVAGVVEDDGDGPSRERRPCGNCQEPLAPHHEYCPRCGEAASGATRERKTKAVGSLANALAELDDAGRREFVADLLQEVDADPSVLGTHESPSKD
ncbi:tyrosine-type recombinase/integrase [Haloarcula amylovorans]|uniref:tyrosine-type recombinase/integrase n=1 Tax=Haloarcula amylovorans TaxID=2562280 RepID=UPI001076989E|nr:tyrosine-type recombinase/integrase [Halomicroarcula amylolytica]